jgi:hypothetical protein
VVVEGHERARRATTYLQYVCCSLAYTRLSTTKNANNVKVKLRCCLTRLLAHSACGRIVLSDSCLVNSAEPVYSCQTTVQLPKRCAAVIRLYSCQTTVQLPNDSAAVKRLRSCQMTAQQSNDCE